MRFFQLIALTPLIIFSAQGQTPGPVMEYAALLNSIDVAPRGELQFGGDNEALTTVFLPQGTAVEAVLTQKGVESPLLVQDFYITPDTKVFSRIDTRGRLKPFQFSEPGEYELTFRAGSTNMTTLAFSVYRETNDDVFDPRTAWYTKGPWGEWAYAYSRLSDGPDGRLEFRMWAKRVSFDGASVTDRYDVELKKDGDVVAVSRTGYVGNSEMAKA